VGGKSLLLHRAPPTLASFFTCTYSQLLHKGSTCPGTDTERPRRCLEHPRSVSSICKKGSIATPSVPVGIYFRSARLEGYTAPTRDPVRGLTPTWRWPRIHSVKNPNCSVCLFWQRMLAAAAPTMATSVRGVVAAVRQPRSAGLRFVGSRGGVGMRGGAARFLGTGVDRRVAKRSQLHCRCGRPIDIPDKASRPHLALG